VEGGLAILVVLIELFSLATCARTTKYALFVFLRTKPDFPPSGGRISMKEERRRRPLVVSRKDLYERVWATPMSQLAASYDVSGNGPDRLPPG
jgi:hypothetical protein